MRRFRAGHLLAVLSCAAAIGVLAWRDTPAAPNIAVTGSESAEVARRLETEFESPLRNVAVLLLDGLPVPATTDSGRALVRRVVTGLAQVEGVTAVVSPASSLDTLLHAHDGSSAIALVGYRDVAALASAQARVTDSVDALHRDGVQLAHGWTGEQPIFGAVRHATLSALRNAELLAAPVTLVAAWWAFGSVISGMLALLVAISAVITGLGLIRLLGVMGQSAPIAEALVILVGAALTLDYLLWRSRGGLPVGSIFRAGGCAAVAFGALLLAPTPELRGAGIGGLVGVAVATLSVTLWSGELRPVKRSASVASIIARAVRRPVLAATGGILLLLALGAWGFTAPGATRPDRWLPEGAEATAVLGRLETIRRGASVAPITVLVPVPAGTTVYDAVGWRVVQGAVERFRGVPGIADVRAITEIGTKERTVTRQVLPRMVRSAWVSMDEGVAVLQLLPSGDADSLPGTVEAVRRIATPGMQVGGLAAVAADHTTAMRDALRPLLALIAIGTGVALVLVFGAPLLAFKAVLIDLFVAGAALGVVALCFPSVRVDGFPATIPLLALGAAFALSIDYELLLLFAVLDRRTAGQDEQVAIVEGTVAATPMMLRGGAMLVALFAAFAVQGFAPLAMTGTVLLAAVVLDITVVRLVLAPALLALWGKWNWWPGGRQEVAGLVPPR